MAGRLIDIIEHAIVACGVKSQTNGHNHKPNHNQHEWMWQCMKHTKLNQIYGSSVFVRFEVWRGNYECCDVSWPYGCDGTRSRTRTWNTTWMESEQRSNPWVGLEVATTSGGISLVPTTTPWATARLQWTCLLRRANFCVFANVYLAACLLTHTHTHRTQTHTWSTPSNWEIKNWFEEARLAKWVCPCTDINGAHARPMYRYKWCTCPCTDINI